MAPSHRDGLQIASSPGESVRRRAAALPSRALRIGVGRLNCLDCVRTEPQRIQNFIGGEFVEPAKGRYLDNIEPGTGKVYSQVPDSDTTDVEKAVDAAEKAFPGWSKTSAAD